MTTPQRVRASHLLAAVLLALVAVVGQRPEQRGHGDLTPPAQPSSPGWGVPPKVYATVASVLIAAVLLAGFAFPIAPEERLSIFLTVALAALTIWTTVGLFAASTPTRPGQEWLVPVSRAVILVTCVLASIAFCVMLETAPDRVTVVAFALCTAASVIADWVKP